MPVPTRLYDLLSSPFAYLLNWHPFKVLTKVFQAVLSSSSFSFSSSSSSSSSLEVLCGSILLFGRVDGLPRKTGTPRSFGPLGILRKTVLRPLSGGRRSSQASDLQALWLLVTIPGSVCGSHPSIWVSAVGRSFQGPRSMCWSSSCFQLRHLIWCVLYDLFQSHGGVQTS